MPAIGRAELESLYGASHFEQLGSEGLLSDLSPDAIDFGRLGGSIRLAAVLGTLPTTTWRDVQAEIAKRAVQLAEDIHEGKIQLGISVYDIHTNPRQLMAAGLEAKKALRAHHYSVRLTPNQDLALSSAQVLHNHLTGERGIELLAVSNGKEAIIARTVAVQDITAYAHRDQNRPKRDAFVGMLPPKLAQTIVNLATGPLTPNSSHVVLDPFCGTGVLLQEAALMGYGIYGSDLEPRMVDYSKQNLDWLAERSEISSPTLEVGDATDVTWASPFTTVACEMYLGRPLSSWPNPEKLQEIIGTCNLIIEKFLRNIVDQSGSNMRMALAVPAWRSPDGRVHHLPMLDHLEKMGYNRVSFEYASDAELVYFRPDQIVARELLVITRK